MGLRTWILGGMAAQLGKPTGLRGRLVGSMLNRSNRGLIAEAIDALELPAGAVAADLGFGGGVGLALLLERVGPNGHVHGVDFSATMVSEAERRYKSDVASGRLHLHMGSITMLPLEGGSIQGAITINTIYFIADLDRAFAELTRVIATSGRAVVGIGDPRMMASIPTTRFGFTIRQVDEIATMAKSAGLILQDHKRAGRGEQAAHLLVFVHGSSA
ncbi:MAG TPA: methyltransferase domain-containing protein [Candidatus Dormibacteraeota bacterium]